MSFVKVYFDFEERTEMLNEVEQGRLLLTMLRYAQGKTLPELKGNERFLFPVFKADIDREAATYATKIENGAKGGRPRQKTENNLTKPDETENNRTEPAFKNKNKNLKNKTEEQEQDQEQEQEQDLDARAALGTVEAYASGNLECLTPSHMAALGDFKRDLPDDVIRYAIDQACGNGAPRWSYVAAILQGFVESGVKTLGDAKARSARHKKQAQKQRNPALNYEQRGDGVERVPMVWED